MAILKFSDLPLGNVKLADTQFVGLQRVGFPQQTSGALLADTMAGMKKTSPANFMLTF